MNGVRSAVVADGLFEVTSDGEVYRLVSGFRFKANTYTAGRARKHLIVSGYKDGKHIIRYVHRLVAEAFIPNPDKLPVVHHIDGDPENNNVLNLQWATYSENTRAWQESREKRQCPVCGRVGSFDREICGVCYFREADRQKWRDKRIEKGARFIGVRTNNEQEATIAEMLVDGMNYSEVAKVYGCSRENIRQKAVRLLKTKSAV